jgi:Alba
LTLGRLFATNFSHERYRRNKVLKINTRMSDAENVQTIIIKSHSNISKTVTKCLAILTATITDSSKLPVVKIVADAKVAGKAITVTEIVKRRIKEHGQAVDQITGVQEKPTETETPVSEEGRKHLQGEGEVKARKKVDAQIIIRLERSEKS